MKQEDIERIVMPLMEAHRCHTVVLYGSHARRDATESSDIDVLFVREDGPAARDARVVDGVYVDAFIYPEAALNKVEPSLLRLLGGVVLREREGFGTALLRRIGELEARGPAPLPDDERRMLVVWSHKMLDRFRGQPGVEANYRRRSLLVQALEDYFTLRNGWFRGPKVAFAWLLENDVATYRAFERAAEPGATDEALADLVRAVYGPPG